MLDSAQQRALPDLICTKLTVESSCWASPATAFPACPGRSAHPWLGTSTPTQLQATEPWNCGRDPPGSVSPTHLPGRHSCTGPGLHTPGPRELILLSSKPQKPGRNSPQRAGIVFLWLKGSVGSHKNGGSTIPLPSTTLGPSHQCP